MLIDPTGLGPELDIALNEQSTFDLLSIVGEKYRDRISVDENGKVSVNLEGLDEKNLRTTDNGLYVINSLVESEKKFYFESNDNVQTGNGDKIMTIDNNGVMNASNGGKDGFGKHTESPKKGYDGQVALAKSGKFVDAKNGNRDVRASTVFHELYENYLRTDGGMDYLPASRGGNDKFGAHARSRNYERRGRGFGNPSPGSGRYRPPSDPFKFLKK